ncbi:phage head closure protein [Caballeronia sp. dw_276]|uniref:phage head closure protein n=1 Tax=Caballeronia sp. dw_276 TaxID=2719795 RepID=UPI001BD28696|nr:phage head closure protein [Caballeronia sp. dw_276]
MQAGKLKHRIQIQRRDSTRDSSGQPSKNWLAFGTPIWASIVFLNGKQFATSGSQANSATASIRIRYRTDITAAMRVLHGTTVYDIVAVLPDEATHDFVDLACTTGANDG